MVASVADGSLSAWEPEGELTIEVRENTVLLRVTLNGQDANDLYGLGFPQGNDFDLYVRVGEQPIEEGFDCVDPTMGTYGLCEIDFPDPGTWHVTANRFVGQGAFRLTAVAFSRAPPARCVGDCDGNGDVTVDELLTMVNIALGSASVLGCGSGGINGNGEIMVDEIMTAVSRALEGCT